MNRSTKTRLLLRDKYQVVHSDRLYRPAISSTVCSTLCHMMTYSQTMFMFSIVMNGTEHVCICKHADEAMFAGAE